MGELHPRSIDYLDAVTHAAQYLASMRPGADRWGEFGELVRRFFDADLVALVYREADGTLSFRYTSPGDETRRTRLMEALRTLAPPVLDSGFLSTESVALPDTCALVLLPLAQEKKVEMLLVVGHQGIDVLPRHLLDIYLAVARLMESTLARLGFEEQLRLANEKLIRTLDELRATQHQIVQSEKLAALGTLAAGVAHELNNPMMGVMGYVSFAAKTTRDPKVREWLEKASRELERMRDLLKNMLGFARPIEGTTTEIDIAAVLERTLALLRPELKTKDITVTTDLPPELPRVMAKEGFLQQVFLNLLLNACDAVEERPVRTIRIGGRVRDERVAIEVSDSGPGISCEDRMRIFDPFFTTKPPGKGTGLGLSIARNIMDDVGGRLACGGREGEGATFTVELPLPPGVAETP